MIFFLKRCWYLYSMRGCPHPDWRVKCIHGDEIIARNFKRSQCMDCFKTLPELPDRCYSASRRAGYNIYHIRS